MSTRAKLEQQLADAKKRLDEASKDTPKELMAQWRSDYDELSFQLDNLYDDEENEFTD